MRACLIQFSFLSNPNRFHFFRLLIYIRLMATALLAPTVEIVALRTELAASASKQRVSHALVTSTKARELIDYSHMDY